MRRKKEEEEEDGRKSITNPWQSLIKHKTQHPSVCDAERGGNSQAWCFEKRSRSFSLTNFMILLPIKRKIMKNFNLCLLNYQAWLGNNNNKKRKKLFNLQNARDMKLK